jgi:signal transduction histidine kinase
MPPATASPIQPAPGPPSAEPDPEDLPGLLFKLDPDGRCCWLNQSAAERLAGAPASAANIELVKSRLHGLANIIAGIQSTADLLCQSMPAADDGSGEPDLAGETSSAIRNSALEARGLLQAIGLLLQGSGGRTEYFDVREQVEKTLGQLRHAVPRGVNVRFECAADSGVLVGLMHDFKIAVANLLLNSFAAMSGGGILLIRITGADGFLHLEFADSGCGLPPADAEQAFDPLFTTGEGKTLGLGLPQVREFAVASGGDVNLTSETGRGTSVVLRLPLKSG